MGRLLQAALLVASTAGVANAGPTRKVKVETTPPGASVYVDSIEQAAACDATPCTIDAPLGTPTLIIRLDKHEVEFIQIDVHKTKRTTPVSVKLKAAIGMITIIDAPKGAIVKVNDEEKGKVGKGPFEIEVPAEPVSVVVTFNGKTIAEELVEVEAGKQAEVTIKSASATSVARSGDDDDSSTSDDDGSSSGDTNTDDNVAEVGETATPTARPPFVEAGLVMDVAFRRFAYSDGSSPFNNSGEFLLGPAVELWPGRLAGVRLLRGLSLFARVQFAISNQKVTKEMSGVPTEIGAQTLWGAIEVSLRNKWQFGSIGVEASGGFLRDQAEFSAISDSVLAMVPSADYQSIRVGARVSYVSTVEPFLAAETRVVLSGGELETRTDNADASGFRVSAGARTKLGPLGVRAEAAYSRYSWTFSNNDPSMATPGGATDTIFWLSFLVGYDY